MGGDATQHMDAVDMAEGHDHSLLGKSVRIGVILLAGLGGAVAGFALTLAIVVLRARLGHYLFDLHDLAALRWETLPAAILMVVGFVLGILHPRGLDRSIGWGLLAMVAGILVGAVTGRALWGAGEGAWSGGIVGGALGLVAGGTISFRHRQRPRPHLFAGAIGAAALVALALIGTLGASRWIEAEPLDVDAAEPAPLPDPANVDAVVFLVGDAGAGEAGRSPLLEALAADVERWSGALGRDSAVSVVFLGDNVYPVGVRERSHPEFPIDSARLWNQVGLVGGEYARRHGTLGIFLPGNHDWGSTSGDEGLRRLANQAALLEGARRGGYKVTLEPASGAPGPAVRDLRSNARLVFVDTHWFLQARHGADRARFFDDLDRALETAGDREVLLMSHHPFASAGPHGVILPGNPMGGVAYLLKKAGALVQDLNSPVYVGFLADLRQAFERTSRPPLVFAAGHDHSLQVLTGAGDFDPRYSLVSGAGSKVSKLEMAPGLLWGGERPGWMMLVFRRDDGVDLFVVAGDADRLTCPADGDAREECMGAGITAFDVAYARTLLEPSRGTVSAAADAAGTPWWTEENEVSTRDLPDKGDEVVQPAPVAVPVRALSPGADTVTTTPGRTYEAGPFRRFLFGDLHRGLWSLPVRLPVLDLDSVAGGLRPLELIGGKQTLGLRFQGRDGFTYEFRSMVKDPDRALPEWLREGIISDALHDQMAAQFPLGALVVSTLLEAAGIEAPAPVPVVMPNDARLGEYRSLFAGRAGLFAMHANERADGGPGFGGHTEILSDEDFEEVLAGDPAVRVDDRYFLRIRLMDMLMGDWDRHAGQWSWAVVEDSAGRRYRPIPEDRDWAFARIDGALTALFRRFFMQRYLGFGPSFPPVRHLAEAGHELDRRILAQLPLEEFQAAADEVQAAITDSVIAAAVARLPASHVAAEGRWLANALEQRRDALDALARDFHAHLAEEAHVFGAAGVADEVSFVREGGSVRVQVSTAGVVRFERVLDRATRRVFLHITPDEDRVTGADDLPFEVAVAEPEEG